MDDRRRRDPRPCEVGDDRALLRTVGNNSEDDALQSLSDERVRTLCERLPADQRDVLLVRLMAGLTIEAIAEALGTSATAVKALQRRGLANLRNALDLDPVSQ